MEIRTARPDNVKKVIEIISPLLTDAVIRFQKDGIYIFAMDAVKVAFVSVHLKSEHFEFYALKQPFDIGVDTSNLNKVKLCLQIPHAFRYCHLFKNSTVFRSSLIQKKPARTFSW